MVGSAVATMVWSSAARKTISRTPVTIVVTSRSARGAWAESFDDKENPSGRWPRDTNRRDIGAAPPRRQRRRPRSVLERAEDGVGQDGRDDRNVGDDHEEEAQQRHP